jgi:hypothetical protein
MPKAGVISLGMIGRAVNVDLPLVEGVCRTDRAVVGLAPA